MKTIDALIDGYGSLSVAQLLEPLAPKFQHQTLPESLGIHVRERDAFEKHAAWLFGLFDEFRLVPRTVVDDPVTGTVAIDAEMLGTLKGGKGDWKNECVMMIRLTEDGFKVLEVKEFVDSAKAIEMAQTHAPEDSGSQARDTSHISDPHSERKFDWRGLDPDLLIQLGAAVAIVVGIRRILF